MLIEIYFEEQYNLDALNSKESIFLFDAVKTEQQDVFHLCILTAIASASADENTADAAGLTELQVPRKLETQKRHLVEEEFTLIGM